MTVNSALALVVEWTKRIGQIALLLIVAMMALKALGVPILWRTPNLDQSTGIALAALAYVLK